MNTAFGLDKTQGLSIHANVWSTTTGQLQPYWNQSLPKGATCQTLGQFARTHTVARMHTPRLQPSKGNDHDTACNGSLWTVQRVKPSQKSSPSVFCNGVVLGEDLLKGSLCGMLFLQVFFCDAFFVEVFLSCTHAEDFLYSSLCLGLCGSL